MRALAATIGLLTALAACGYRGPLYLPQAKPQATVPPPPASAPPERPVPSEAAPAPK